MIDDDRNLPYSQRYGHEPMPKPMGLGELSEDLRREIWNQFHRLFEANPLMAFSLTRRGAPADGWHKFNSEAVGFAKRVLGGYLGLPENRVISKVDGGPEDAIERIVMAGKDHFPLKFLELAVNDPFLKDDNKTVVLAIKELFEGHRASCYLDIEAFPYRIFLRTSKEEGDAITQSMQKLNKSGFAGALSHLHQARNHIHQGQYPDAMVDSIHAVESVARYLAPKSNSLVSALNRLEERGDLKLHKALKGALGKLYGYTSDEQGIRHSLIDGEAADVGLEEALFFYAACASFAGYLANKARNARS